MDTPTLKRISIILKAASLLVAPTIYLLKVGFFSAAKAQGITDEGLLERIAQKIQSDPIWLIIAFIFTGSALAIDFILTYEKNRPAQALGISTSQKKEV